MKYDEYGFKIKKGEEDEEYFKNRELIDVIALGNMFEQKAQVELLTYEKILCRFEEYSDAFFKFPMNTSLRKEQLKELVKRFFLKINNDMYEQINELFEKGEDADAGKTDFIVEIKDIEDKGHASCYRIDMAGIDMSIPLEDIKEKDPELYERYKKLMEPTKIVTVTMTRVGNILDLYNLVHELTHFLILKEHKQTGLLDEIAPHCTERLLDDFLISLTPDECSEFNIEKNKLIEDVLLRNIITFAIRYNEVKEFNKDCNNSDKIADEQEELKYILALIYQSQFIKLNHEQKKATISEIIDCAGHEDLNRLNEILEINWGDKQKRQEYIEKPIYDVQHTFELYKSELQKSKKTIGNVFEGNNER